jgi:hypothetical protein
LAGLPAPGPPVVRLAVPYVHQVLDIESADGNWACGPTSVVMVLAYYGKLEPWPTYVVRQGRWKVERGEMRASSAPVPTAILGKPQPKAPHIMTLGGEVQGEPSFAPYVTEVYTSNGRLYNATAADPQGKRVAGLYGTICPTGLASWPAIVSVLQWHGLSSRHVPATWEGVTAALKRGHPVLLSTNLTEVGHILVATGYTANGYLIVNDPYGNRFAPGYGGTNGRELRYFWNRMIVSTALEVVGTYPTPSPTPSNTAVPTPSLTPITTARTPSTRQSPASPAHAPAGTRDTGSDVHMGVGQPTSNPLKDSSESLYHRRC